MQRLTLALLISTGLPALAHQPYQASFEGLDQNKDAVLSLEEVNASIDLYFTTHDLNGDGVLSGAEFPDDKNQLRAGLNRVPKQKVAPDPTVQASSLLERLDADENGALSFEELNGAALKRFEAQDTDGDGELSLEELEADAQARADKRSAKPKSSLSRSQKLFVKWDVDGDGFVAASEVPRDKILKNLAKVFADLDKDGDEQVGLEEFSVFLK